MSFKNLIKKKNKLLLPVSWLYLTGVRFFNFLYDSGLKQSTSFSLPVICIGNLSVGGTGKSPMVEYLVRLLKDQYKIAVVSRGYGRKTKGVLVADRNSTAAHLGDEPMQFHQKFPAVTVAVGERRAEAMQTILPDQKPEVIILDDAFQHRAVKAGFNILLTEFTNIFTGDYYLPAGQLRDLRSNYTRAQCIVVTKCPERLTQDAAHLATRSIQLKEQQALFYATLAYDPPVPVFGGTELHFDSVKTLLLVTGIANPLPLQTELEKHGKAIVPFYFDDHYDFQEPDIDRILQAFKGLPAGTAAMITTEKDSTRLQQFKEQLQHFPVYALPVRHRFLFGGMEKFNILIADFIKKFEKP
ncbi:MAG: tetraacyldisaccharide 4'-kinase [Niabella sp.]|nr:tetraacyldisaccharide 4'-kinase [Niabella sp.]